MTTLEKAAKAIAEERIAGNLGPLALARAAIEALRTPGIENTDRIFNAMLDHILKEEV